jgi:hypothetical protein
MRMGRIREAHAAPRAMRCKRDSDAVNAPREE